MDPGFTCLAQNCPGENSGLWEDPLNPYQTLGLGDPLQAMRWG